VQLNPHVVTDLLFIKNLENHSNQSSDNLQEELANWQEEPKEDPLKEEDTDLPED